MLVKINPLVEDYLLMWAVEANLVDYLEIMLIKLKKKAVDYSDNLASSINKINPLLEVFSLE